MADIYQWIQDAVNLLLAAIERCGVALERIADALEKE